MNEQALAPVDYGYQDVLMQREHLSRQQRIRHRATVNSSRRRTPVGNDFGVPAAGKAQITTSTGETTTCRVKMQRRRYKPMDHSSEHGISTAVEAIGKAKQDGQAKYTTSSRGNTRGEMRLAKDHRDEDRESNARRLEKKKREDAAQQHYLNAMLLKIWRELASVTEIAHLQKVKAERHHQHCVMHRMWINLSHNVICSRAHKTEQVERLVISLSKREAWRRWKHHHHGLVNASYMVRRERDTSLMSQHFTNWIEAWTTRARQSAAVEHAVTRSGLRARKSRFLREWKAAVETSKQHALLFEERFQMWQRVRHWLTPADSL